MTTRFHQLKVSDQTAIEVNSVSLLYLHLLAIVPIEVKWTEIVSTEMELRTLRNSFGSMYAIMQLLRSRKVFEATLVTCSLGNCC